MPKDGWLYRQFEWIEKDSEKWPAWMKEGIKIECSSEKTETGKRKAKPKNQKSK